MLHGMFHAEEQVENSSFILSTSKVFLTGFPVLFALCYHFSLRSFAEVKLQQLVIWMD